MWIHSTTFHIVCIHCVYSLYHNVDSILCIYNIHSDTYTEGHSIDICISTSIPLHLHLYLHLYKRTRAYPLYEKRSTQIPKQLVPKDHLLCMQVTDTHRDLHKHGRKDPKGSHNQEKTYKLPQNPPGPR